MFILGDNKKSFERLDAFRKKIGDVEIRLANPKFEAAIAQIQSFIQEPRGKKFAFILVDPKGWDGFSMSAMGELVRLPFVEVLVNFMTSFIKRFLESQFPVVWDSDLKDWLAEWKEARKIELPDLKQRERVPKLRSGHRIVRKISAL